MNQVLAERLTELAAIQRKISSLSSSSTADDVVHPAEHELEGSLQLLLQKRTENLQFKLFQKGDDFQSHLKVVLEALGKLTQAERCYVFLTNEAGTVCACLTF